MTYIVILLCGAIPTALAPTVQSATGLIVVRCFTGILGAAFVPCQVWAAGFFDKNVVGAVTALAAGLGNAGGGITFFAMPAIFDSLVNHRGLSDDRAWRLAFLVPLLLILTTAGLIAWICPDTPTGPWSARHRALNHQLSTRDMFVSTARSRDGGINEKNAPPVIKRLDSTQSDSIGLNDHGDVEYQEDDLLAAASWELVQKPTISQSVNAVFSIQAVSLFFLHFSSFGAELSVMSLLAAYYYKEFPSLGQTGAGNWAAFFGLLNVFARPFSGLVSDALYRPRGSLWARKIWIHVVGVTAGIFACVIGVANPTTKPALFGLMAAFAFFIEAGNGAQFALVPHVHPSSNGMFHRPVFLFQCFSPTPQASSPDSHPRPAALAASSSRCSPATKATNTTVCSSSSAFGQSRRNCSSAGSRPSRNGSSAAAESRHGPLPSAGRMSHITPLISCPSLSRDTLAFRHPHQHLKFCIR